MDRRRFLGIGACIASATLFRPFALAEQECGPAMATPYGPMQRCTAGIESIEFQPAYQTQKASEWCWAACISMIFGFHGHPVDQLRIVNETWGGIVNMPGQPQTILANLNRSWKDDNGDDFSSQGDSFSANQISAVMDLQQDEPLIIGALGHAMILTALTADTNLATGAWQIVAATVRDPWPYNPQRRILSPMEWMNIQFAARVRVSD